MPFLMVNLNDAADCRQAIQHLKARLQGAGPAGRGQPRRQAAAAGLGCGGPAAAMFAGGSGPAAVVFAGGGGGGGRGQARGGAGVGALPLPQKLRRIQPRGVWKHLVAIARESPEPRSLTEWDEALGLQANKMRSLKAIMAKLENRFGLRFLVPNEQAGADDAGNPRYAMPPRVRAVILRLADEAAKA
jgi:hypothetical protein